MKQFRAIVFLATCLYMCCHAAQAQWDPANGEWGKEQPTDLRIVTWNVFSGICSTNAKQEGQNNWTGIARIIAALQPDVIILQETGDNVGNGTGAFSDSVSALEATAELLIYGGPDVFFPGQQVTAFVRQYVPGFEMPYVFASSVSDGFNRNLIISRYPFADINGDTRAVYSNFSVQSDAYAPGGTGGIRGFQFAEIDLPNDVYAGDLVVANAHLKAFGDSSSMTQRLTAAQNTAYFIDYFYNGAGTGMPDPSGTVNINPPATTILDENTPVIWGGDWNEDEATNGRRGPAAWMTEAEFAGGVDGTDRDRTDSMFDDARDVFSNNRATFGSGTKLDYIAWQDSVAQLRRHFVFRTDNIPGAALPPELLSFNGFPQLLGGLASDHRPVVADFILPLAPDPVDCPWDLTGDGSVGSADLGALLGQWGSPYGSAELAALLGSWGPCEN